VAAQRLGLAHGDSSMSARARTDVVGVALRKSLLPRGARAPLDEAAQALVDGLGRGRGPLELAQLRQRVEAVGRDLMMASISYPPRAAAHPCRQPAPGTRELDLDALGSSGGGR